MESASRFIEWEWRLRRDSASGQNATAFCLRPGLSRRPAQLGTRLLPPFESHRKVQKASLFKYFLFRHSAFGGSGDSGGTRTPDLMLRRHLLYPSELRSHIE